MAPRTVSRLTAVSLAIFASCLGGLACGHDRLVALEYSDAGKSTGGSSSLGLDNQPCTVDNDCYSGYCDSSGAQHTCQERPSCDKAGDACNTDSDCCSGVCPTATLHCSQMSSCHIVGQSCTTSAECCSGTCADSGTGTKKCQALDGCKPIGETCSVGGDCCSWTIFETNANNICHCVPPNPPLNCLLEGEICTPVSGATPCCGRPPGGGGPQGGGGGGGSIGAGGTDPLDNGCRLTSVGVFRCWGPANDGSCSQFGPCNVHEDCCSSYCLPGIDPRSTYSCAPGCSFEGGPCAADRDCCTGGPPWLTCVNNVCQKSGITCKPLGFECLYPADCCSGSCAPVLSGGTRCVVPLP